jgi:L,D-peptidoglycan transpeptidase YkuD (ErfK/YbiS/YcfS/YnhG family)
MIIAGVESLLYVVMKTPKNGEHVARRRIGPVDMWSDEQNRQNEAEVVDG